MLKLLTGWQGYVAIAGLCFLAGVAATWRVMSWRQQAEQASEAKNTVQLVLGSQDITTKAEIKLGDIILQDRTRTVEITREIPSHVTPEIDAQYPVPFGFVRVWNAASHGPIPDAASGPDAAPSGVPLSDVAEAHAADEGILDVCRAQVTGWQEWYQQIKAYWDKRQ